MAADFCGFGVILGACSEVSSCVCSDGGWSYHDEWGCGERRREAAVIVGMVQVENRARRVSVAPERAIEGCGHVCLP